MSNELFDILSHSNKDIDNQKLMDYLSGKLSEKEKTEMESMMAGNDFFQDAVEGLGTIKDPARVKVLTDQLKHDLQRHLKKNPRSRRYRRIQEYPWIYFTIVLILLICIIGYLIIRQFLH